MRLIVGAGAAALTITAAATALLATGRLAVDVGVGRRVRRLGPQVVRIGATRERVFDLIAVPYLSERPPRELRDKIEVLERSGGLVIAAHRTKVGRITTVTVESVELVRPSEVRFRLLRGPVPYVRERFVLRGTSDGRSTELEYSGEMGTDLGPLGALWGDLVARYWERAVADALASLRRTCESAAARAEERESRSERR